MRLRFSILVCCLVAATFAVEETKPKKQSVDNRGKRNLEYTIYHNYQPANSHRSERRISTGLQQRFSSPLFPGPRPYSPYRKGRPHSLPPPPYAVQMEPLIHYSQRDPLYDTNTLSLIADNNNDPSKPEDLLTENNVVSENVYGAPKHYIDRPIYIREPEPIIEIIIKESNITLPPPPTPPPTSAPKKKEQVQVFYVKYKKNPNGHGKDSIVYDKPIPAISPPVEDEHEEVEQPPISYGIPEHVTAAPPPSTTLRTIIKPDSETYHSPSGIKVTFGKESFDYDKRSSKADDDEEGSAPEPAVTQPEARQFPLQQQPIIQRRQPVLSSYQTGPTFRPEIIRFPSPAFRAFTSSQYRHPGPILSKPYSSLPPSKSREQSRLVPHFQAPLTRPSSPQFSQALPNYQSEFTFNGPRQPVPYQPFTYLKPQQPSSPSPSPSSLPQLHSQFEFPTHTHFPIQQQQQQQQLPLPQQQQIFHQQLTQRYPTFQPQSDSGAQQYTLQKQPQQYQHESVQQIKQPTPQPQLQYTQQPTAQVPQQQQYSQIQYNKQQQQQLQQQQQQLQQHQQQEHHQQQQQRQQLQQQQQQLQQQFYQQQLQKHEQSQQQQQPQQQQRLVPPGGELIQSLSKYEQHISVPVDPSQQPQKQEQLTPEQYKQQILQQYIQKPSQNQFAQNAQTQSNPHENYSLKPSISTYYTTARPSPTKQIYVSSTSTTERPTTPKPTESTTIDTKSLNVQLPDEVPDELRQQLLSSGILKNADISVLDYDKVGDIPLSALPPDQLANFFNAGGAQQIAGSEPVPEYVNKDGSKINDEKELSVDASETSEVRVPAPVEMKVVHYNPETEQGQKVQDFYVKDTATQLDPVVLDDQTYNKYLPLKVNGAEFPIPDVPELKGKNITSVVVLAPVTYSATKRERKTREVEAVSSDVELITENLKELVENPSRENYEKFLENENKTSSEKQSVILLVAEAPSDGSATEKEIYMYDIATKTVNKLSGELSAAFVEAAEANADEEKAPAELASASSNTVELKATYPDGAEDRLDEEISESDLSDSASDFIESKVPIVEPSQGDLETDASEQVESLVNVDSQKNVSASENGSGVSISSGYSRFERN